MQSAAVFWVCRPPPPPLPASIASLPSLCPSSIAQVYNAYYHGFTTLRDLPPVRDLHQNAALATLLRRLVDEHCARPAADRCL